MRFRNTCGRFGTSFSPKGSQPETVSETIDDPILSQDKINRVIFLHDFSRENAQSTAEGIPDRSHAKKTAAQKSTTVFEKADAIQPVGSLGLAGSDQAHLVDLVCVAATGQVVDGSVQALQDGAVSCVAAQTLGDLVADVAGLDAGEDEGVGLTSHLAALALDLCNFGSNGSFLSKKPNIVFSCI